MDDVNMPFELIPAYKKLFFEEYLIPSLTCFANFGIDGKLILQGEFFKPYEISIRDLIYQHFKEAEPVLGDAEKRMDEFLTKIKATV